MAAKFKPAGTDPISSWSPAATRSLPRVPSETVTEQLLAPLQHNERALTPLFNANFDEGMLREIAEADYGESANECYALLQPILKTGLVESYDSMLNEVLHLISFSEPETSDFSPGGQGRRVTG